MTRSFVLCAFVLLAVPVAGCVEPTACAGTTTSGACLRVRDIWPCWNCGFQCTGGGGSGVGRTQFTFSVTNATRAVDLVQDVCVKPSTMMGAAESFLEPYADHDAVFAVVNEPREMNARGGAVKMPAAILRNLRIEYFLDDCPPGDTCPTPTPINFVPGNSVSFETAQTHCFVLPLFPIRRKVEARADVTVGSFPAYTARYVLEAQEAKSEHRFTMEAFTHFTLGNYNNCPAGSYPRP